MQGVLILGGPTASGKTELALDLAGRFDAEIIGADSRQIYRGMSIGTAAPTPEQRARVRHHLVEFLDPHERYSAARFVADALQALEAIERRGKRAIVAGGTGFYLRAVAGDVSLSLAYDPELRARLAREARLHPTKTLHDWLTSRDPVRARAIAPSDPYRIVRALEVALSAERSLMTSDGGGAEIPRRSLRSLGVPLLKVAVDVDDATLDQRIAARVDRMLAVGLLEEAERIGADAVAADAVGYPQALGYLAGLSNYDELRMLLIRATRQYARRQRTWFRGEPEMHFLAHDAVAAAARELPGWS